MLNIQFWNYAKKNNSTKIPNTSGTVIQCELKDDCNMLAPVIRLRNAATNLSWNYCYIPGFGRYYFINDWRWVNCCWEASCSIDALGSWKQEIGVESMYILRHDSDVDYNELICDTLYPATNDFSTRDDTLSNDPFHSAISQGVAGGTYVVGIISGESVDSVGAITYFAMTPYQFGQLKSILFSNDNLIQMDLAASDGQGGITALVNDMSLEVLKTMYNPFQYIASAFWFPFLDSVLINSDPVQTIRIGWWDYPLNGLKIRAQVVTFTQTQALTNHPQAATRGNYLNFAPYRRAALVGRFGDIPLDMSYYSQAANTVALKYDVDLITGQCKIHIGYQIGSGGLTHTEYYMTREFLLAVPIQLAQVGVDYLGVAVTAVDTAAGMASSFLHFDPAGAVSKAANGVYNTLNASMPQMETGGTNGAFIGAYTETHLITQYFRIVDEDIHHKGRPLCANRTINTLSGYILCADGEFDIGCTEEERSIIVNYLTGGFFWE